MARRRSPRASNSMSDRAQRATGRGIAAWAAFTWGMDNVRIGGKVSHVLVNWLVTFALGAAWALMWHEQAKILALITLLAVIYTAARAGRHLPGRRKTVEALFGKTRSVFKHPTGRDIDPSDHVVVTRWASPKKPLLGRVAVGGDSAVATPGGRRKGEQAIEAVVKARLKEDETVLFDHGNGDWVNFEVVPADDERARQQKVARYITGTAQTAFPPRRQQDEPETAFEWGELPPHENEPDAPVPSLITIAYGNYDTLDPEFRTKTEATFDARLPLDFVWLYDWSSPTQLSIEPVAKDSSDAVRKSTEARVRSAAEGAIAKGATATIAKQSSATVTGWSDEPGAQNTPSGIRIEMGSADMSDKRSQAAIEDTLDRALTTELPDRVWLLEWTHSTPTTLELRAVARDSVEGRRKLEEQRLRQVVRSKFRAARGAEPPSLEVTAWGEPLGDPNVPAGHVPERDWDAQAQEVEVNFGSIDVTDQRKRQEFQSHLDSQVEGVNDWRYEWNPQNGTVHITAVPVLPTYVRFPDEDTPAAQQWHDDFRRGKINLGPAKGGFMPTLDLNKSPHMLVGGATGAGKSYLLNIILYGALRNIDTCELVVVDPKATDFTWAAFYPNVRRYAVRDARTAIEEIEQVVAFAESEMMRRQNLLKSFGAEDLGQLRQFAREGRFPELTVEDVPRRLIVFFDEGGSAFTPSKDKDLKALQDTARTKMEQIAMLGRAMEVNIVMAAQKPSKDNIGTAMREQLVIRIAVGYLNSDTSIQVLGNTLATDLLGGAGKGRGVLSDDQGRDLVFQTYYLPRYTGDDVIEGAANRIEGIQERVAAHLESQGWLSVPEETTFTISREDESGQEIMQDVKRMTYSWVRADRVEA